MTVCAHHNLDLADWNDECPLCAESLDERYQFERGYSEGERDAASGTPRALVTAEGSAPPIVKGDDSAYYHGYKAAVEGVASDEESAWAAYVAKHSMQRNSRNMDYFTRQYFETALWSSTDESDDSGGKPLDDNYSVDDIAPDTRARMIADCTSFQERNFDLLARSGLDDGKAGHYFWLSRNGHGAGFFDEDFDELQEAAEAYGQFDLLVGDDGLIHGYGYRDASPNPLHLKLDGNFSFGIGTQDDKAMRANASSLWEVAFQAASPRRPGLFTTFRTDIRAETEEEAWAKGRADLERRGFNVRERVGQAVRYRFVQEENDYEPNARKNVSAVINAFLAGRRHSEKTCSTDGWRLYSYSLLIAARVDANGEPIDVGAPGARVLVLDKLASPSRTTSAQINAVPGAEVVSDMPYASRYMPNATEHEPNCGIYKGTGAETDDYVVFPMRSGGFGVDWVMSGGTHMTIGPTKGYPSLEAAMQGARDDGFKRGRTSGIIFQHRDDGLHQVGHVKKSNENYADNPRKGQFKTPPGLTPAETFFFQQSGYIGREGVSAAQVKRERIESAKAMAAAEEEGERRGWTVEWQHDEDPDTSWMDDEAMEDYREGRMEILAAVLKDENGNVLGSIGGVSLSTTGSRDPYARWLEMELIQEALAAEESSSRAMALNPGRHRSNPWYRTMDLAQVTQILGAAEVARVLAADHPQAHATVRARGHWDSNEGDFHDAYTNLSRLIKAGALDDLIAETRARR